MEKDVHGMTMISIVITAYNEEKNIHSCLSSIANIPESKEAEIILVDNTSTDRTVEIAKKWEHQMRLRIIHEERKGRSQAKYTGFQAASGDIIFSTDADTEVPENWIRTMMGIMQDPRIVAVTGLCSVSDMGNIRNAILQYGWILSKRLHCILKGYPYITANNFAVRKSVYLAAGEYDTNLLCGEDVELSRRLHRQGKIHFDPRICVRTSSRTFQRGILRGAWYYCHTDLLQSAWKTRVKNDTR